MTPRLVIAVLVAAIAVLVALDVMLLAGVRP